MIPARRTLTLASAALLLAASACTPDGSETGPDGEGCDCGDPDGDGTDTGDIPSVLGNWTTTFGYQMFMETCGIDDLSPESEGWINNAAMHVGGYLPDGLYAYFGDDNDEEFFGIVTSHGSIGF